jgi:hypothetical protein
MEVTYSLSSYAIRKGRKNEPNLKETKNKILLETKLPWIKCLPIVLLQISTAPRKDTGISLYEMLYGLPYLGKPLISLLWGQRINFLRNMC